MKQKKGIMPRKLVETTKVNNAQEKETLIGNDWGLGIHMLYVH